MTYEILMPSAPWRERFRKRALRFYAESGVSVRVLIGDLWHPLADHTAQSDADYFLLISDDDFLMPGFIQPAIHFLDEHPDYSGVGGACQFVQAWRGWIWQRWMVTQYAADQPSSPERMRQIMTVGMAYVVAVRAAPLRDALQFIVRENLHWRMAELAMSLYLVGSGKVGILPDLALCREIHSEPRRTKDKIPISEWLKLPYAMSETNALRDWMNEQGLDVQDILAEYFKQRTESVPHHLMRRGCRLSREIHKYGTNNNATVVV